MIIRKLLLGASIAAIASSAAFAADLIIPTTPQPIMQTSSGFDWEGLYIGARVGGQFVGTTGVYANQAANTTYGVIGAVAGVNFIPFDPMLVGVEVTGDYLWNNGLSSSEFFANLRVGAVVTDSALVYALGGVGVANTNGAGTTEGVYQLGGGVEFAVTDAITVRGEVVGQGDFRNEAGDQFFEAAKATVGVFYHF